jgi:hypothetical protein
MVRSGSGRRRRRQHRSVRHVLWRGSPSGCEDVDEQKGRGKPADRQWKTKAQLHSLSRAERAPRAGTRRPDRRSDTLSQNPSFLIPHPRIPDPTSRIAHPGSRPRSPVRSPILEPRRASIDPRTPRPSPLPPPRVLEAFDVAEILLPAGHPLVAHEGSLADEIDLERIERPANASGPRVGEGQARHRHCSSLRRQTSITRAASDIWRQ